MYAEQTPGVIHDGLAGIDTGPVSQSGRWVRSCVCGKCSSNVDDKAKSVARTAETRNGAGAERVARGTSVPGQHCSLDSVVDSERMMPLGIAQLGTRCRGN